MKNFVDYTNFSSIDSPNGRKAKELNTMYNWSAVPDEDRYQQDHTPGTDTFQIDIGDPDAVQKFKAWNRNYWELQKDISKRTSRKKSGETGSNARVEP